MRAATGGIGAPFHTGHAPETEGRRDGYAGAPPNRGYYGDDDWLRYLIGYHQGSRAKARAHIDAARAILAKRVAHYADRIPPTEAIDHALFATEISR